MLWIIVVVVVLLLLYGLGVRSGVNSPLETRERPDSEHESGLCQRSWYRIPDSNR